MTEHNPKFITASNLKSRGWTDGAIKRFLGEPNQTKPNPHRRSGPPMRLYSEARADAAERSLEWKDWFEKSKIRRQKLSEVGQANADQKRQRMIAHVDGIDIQIPVLSSKDLYRSAVQHYNDLWASRGDHDKSASLDDDRGFRDRIAVNMLRHSFSSYDSELEGLFGMVGRGEGSRRLKTRVLNAISDKYPILATECARQIDRSQNPEAYL